MSKQSRGLVITNLFPNSAQKTRGMFVWHEIQQLKQYYDLKVISPLPWVPPLLRSNPRYAYQAADAFKLQNGVECYYPRYVITPRLMRSMYGHLMYWGIRRCVQKIINSWSPDFVIAYYAFPDGFAGLSCARSLNVPVLVKILGSDVNVFTRNRFRRWMTHYTLCNADRVVTVSKALKKRTVSLGVPEENISVVTNGVDREKFYPRDRKECRERLGLPSLPFMFIFIGNMITTKGVDILLDAFELIPTNLRAKGCLVMVGGGDRDQEILRRIKQPNLAPFVFKFPPVLHSHIPLWLGASDCLILPSFAEGYPNVLVESLACGKPVIASDVGGIPEIVEHGKNGILIPSGNRESLVKAMISFLHDRPQKYEIQTNVRTWSDVAEDMRLEIRGMFSGEQDWRK